MTYTDRLVELKTALSRLEEALKEVKNQLDKDGAIQRFEFVFELTWKTLKDFAEDKGRMEANSPKGAFRVAADLGVIGDPQPWFEFLKSRNDSSHLYNEESANRVFSQLPDFVSAMKDLIVSLDKIK
ncbi:nucleotidyltransferase substrate binding protein [Candidatus Collierbacteria bacterium]|nr:nucleotidyltransferase substrate binding protein [Candidatus Collierbacteria bacterium]